MIWSEVGGPWDARQAPPGMSLLSAKPVARNGKHRMKPETVRIPVMTSPSPGAARVPAFEGAVAGSWDGRRRVSRTSHGMGLDGRHHYSVRVRGSGLAHLSGSGCAGARADVPLWRGQTWAFAAAQQGL